MSEDIKKELAIPEQPEPEKVEKTEEPAVAKETKKESVAKTKKAPAKKAAPAAGEAKKKTPGSKPASKTTSKAASETSSKVKEDEKEKPAAKKLAAKAKAEKATVKDEAETLEVKKTTAKAKAEKSAVKAEVKKTVAKIKAEKPAAKKSAVKAEAGEPAAKGEAVKPAAKAKAKKPAAKAEVKTAALKAKTEAPVAKDEAETLVVAAEANKPAAKAKAKKPAAKAEVETPALEVKTENSAVKADPEKPTAKGKVEEPAAKSDVETTEIKGEAEKSVVKAEVEASVLKAEAKEPEAKAEVEVHSLKGDVGKTAVKAKAEEPAVKAGMEIPAVNAEGEKPTVKGKAENPAFNKKGFAKLTRKKEAGTPKNAAEKSALWAVWLRPVVVLVAVCLITSVLLGITNSITQPLIEKNAAAAEEAARKELLPEAAAFEDVTPDPLPENITSVHKGEGDTGYVIGAYGKGYGGKVPVLVAIDAEGRIAGVKFLANDETPGLGQKVVSDKNFAGQFAGLDAGEQVESGQVKAIAAATISTNAAIAAINTAAEYYGINIMGGTLAYSLPEEALKQLLPKAGGWKELDVQADGIAGAYLGYDGTYVLVAQGRGEAILFAAVAMDARGTITGLWLDTSAETPGFGQDLSEDKTFIAQFVGKKDTGKVQTVAGASKTSDGVAKAVEAALAALPAAKEAA